VDEKATLAPYTHEEKARGGEIISVKLYPVGEPYPSNCIV